MVINPRPPTCIINKITICPKTVQFDAVSTTTSPVTQVALVAVNSAVKKSVSPPAAVDIGSINSNVPAPMTSRYPMAMIRT